MGLGFESQRDHFKPPQKRGLFYAMAFVYIIYSAKVNKYYVGACTNLERRLYEHNIGHSTFTSTGIPWELRYTEQFASLQEAKKENSKSRKKSQESISRI